MVITNNKQIYNKIKKLKAFGINKDIKLRKRPGEYNVTELGFNYRITDFQACLGYMQLKRYKLNLNKRRLIAKKYFLELSKIKKLKVMPYINECSYFVYQIFCRSNNERNKLIEFLKLNNIGCSIHYLRPLHLMKYYKKKHINKNKYFYSEMYGKTNISLPVYPKLNLKGLNYIIGTIKKFYKEK